jgi:hypothetical protein
MRQDNASEPDDLDVELARLLAQHHDAQGLDVRLHLSNCPCCSAMAQMFAGLRADLWAIVEGRYR